MPKDLYVFLIFSDRPTEYGIGTRGLLYSGSDVVFNVCGVVFKMAFSKDQSG